MNAERFELQCLEMLKIPKNWAQGDVTEWGHAFVNLYTTKTERNWSLEMPLVFVPRSGEKWTIELIADVEGPRDTLRILVEIL